MIHVRGGGTTTEVATFRSDGPYADGRRPESVTFASAEADAKRRDFSINGLFYDPDADRVIDYVGGQADLAAKVLRAIGDPAERFAEDHLRLLRAVRFAARFGLTIEPATAAAMDAAAPLLPRISAERIAEELRRILTAPTRDAGYRLLWKHALLGALLPTAGDAGLDETRSLVLRLSPEDSIPFPLVWLATLMDAPPDLSATRVGLANELPGPCADRLGSISPSNAEALVRLSRSTLRLSNDELDAIGDIARQTHIVLMTTEPNDAKLKRFLARSVAPQARQLLDALAATGVAVERIAALRPRFETLSRGDVAPPPLVTGDDLVRAGHAPGRAFKAALDAAYDAQLNGEVVDTAAAFAVATRMLESD